MATDTESDDEMRATSGTERRTGWARWRLAGGVGLLALLAWSSGYGPRAAAAEQSPTEGSPIEQSPTERSSTAPVPAEVGLYGRPTSAGWMGGPLVSHPASVGDGG